MHIKKSCLGFLLVVSSGWAQAMRELPSVQWVGEATVPEAVKGESVVVSGEIYNPHTKPVMVFKVNSPAAGSSFLQTVTRDAQDSQVVARVKTLTIPPKGHIVFGPGALELRLAGLTDNLIATREIPLEFTLDNQQTQTLRVAITGQQEKNDDEKNQ